MLPVFRAISFLRLADKGGRTKPWVVLVDANGQLVPYVVKPFAQELIEENDSVTREVLGNVLATEFGLHAPQAALIVFDMNFLSSLREPFLLEQIENGDDRVKFGSKLLEGYYRFDPSTVQPSDASRMIGLDSLFAFDNLIRNPDRN